jgi:hypothetical protein
MTEAEKIAGRIDLILSYTARRDLLAWHAGELHKPLTIERREQLEIEFRRRAASLPPPPSDDRLCELLNVTSADLAAHPELATMFGDRRERLAQ